ncbi:thioredoxin domain-containing protein [Sulfurospirillum arcachonense]|uniref:thioredoxin domain-containing protein n=1 Tax=Sulfurospirillum arcachonense TaxID=57666 RepID=UPI0004B74866|nr:thioredoxin domain-containing protein [Sulfurospirillum arcachonense]
MITNTDSKTQYTNALIKEDSPYLQQHAYNPVAWYAWGEEAFELAKTQNKLIFLSIGYSTCHWCHVMEEESFENEEIAKILNKYFISIKVDREEMPHIDKYYQDVHNLLNKRGGGWPLTIVMTPFAKAFFAATYIPNQPKYGRSGIKELLLQIEGVYQRDTQKVIQSSLEIERILKEHKDSSNKEKVVLNSTIVSQFISDVESSFDNKHFGIGIEPKFPHASTVETLLDIYSVYNDEKALDMATSMLKAMANGGINDQIEGGFYRYSVDAAWMIPHFEKMLYTNAELLSAYAKAYKITQDEFYKNQVDAIVNFVRVRFEKDLLHYSASDADSLVGETKEEGAYFVFDYKQTKEYLQQKGYKNTQEILEYFNISKQGNFEHQQNNPYLNGKNEPENLSQIKKDLKKLRTQKEYPFIDYKILTAWNALYITSLFEAGYSKEACIYLDTLVNKLYIDGELYHQRLIEKKPKVKGLFEDYSFLISALIKAYDSSLDQKYLTLALTLNDEAITKFYKNENWYMSDDTFQTVSSIYDSSYKSALSNMLDNLLKLAVLHEDLNLQKIFKDSLDTNSLTLTSSPSNSAWLVRNYISFEKGYIVLKATKEMLKKEKIPLNPFLLKKVINEKKYLACSVNSCFAYSNNLDEILKKIEAY